MPFLSTLQYGSGHKMSIFPTVSQHNNEVTKSSITIHRLTERRLCLHNNEVTESSITVHRLTERRLCLPTRDEAWITEQWKVMATDRVSERQLVCERRWQIHYSNWCHTVCRSRRDVGRPASRHIRVQECCALSRRTHWRARVIRRRCVWRRPDRR